MLFRVQRRAVLFQIGIFLYIMAEITTSNWKPKQDPTYNPIPLHISHSSCITSQSGSTAFLAFHPASVPEVGGVYFMFEERGHDYDHGMKMATVLYTQLLLQLNTAKGKSVGAIKTKLMDGFRAYRELCANDDKMITSFVFIVDQSSENKRRVIVMGLGPCHASLKRLDGTVIPLTYIRPKPKPRKRNHEYCQKNQAAMPKHNARNIKSQRMEYAVNQPPEPCFGQSEIGDGDALFMGSMGVFPDWSIDIDGDAEPYALAEYHLNHDKHFGIGVLRWSEERYDLKIPAAIGKALWNLIPFTGTNALRCTVGMIAYNVKL